MEPEFDVYKALSILVTRQVWTILTSSLYQHNLVLQTLPHSVAPTVQAECAEAGEAQESL